MFCLAVLGASPKRAQAEGRSRGCSTLRPRESSSASSRKLFFLIASSKQKLGQPEHHSRRQIAAKHRGKIKQDETMVK